MVRVEDVLALATDEVGELRSPVMLVGLSGLFDIGGAATTALDRLVPSDATLTIGEIDPDPFYDFTQARPYVVITDGQREIQWPDNSFELVRTERRDLVVMVGTEPHLHWRTYTDCLITAAERLGCEVVVTAGSFADTVPHTRPPIVRSSTTDEKLAAALGIGGPTYEGPTGVAGVLQVALAERGISAISIRVGVPHYLMNTDQPAAVQALRRHLSHVLGLPAPMPSTDEVDELDTADELHRELVENDEQLGRYVAMLELEYDRANAGQVPSAEELGAQFERYLEQFDRPGHDEGTLHDAADNRVDDASGRGDSDGGAADDDPETDPKSYE